MLSRNKTFEDKVKNFILKQQTELKRDDEWIETVTHINFWDFLSLNYLELDRFFTLLDIETGPTSGWEKFVEALGLNLWEDRKWCHQYHNGGGPTRAALSKILSKRNYDASLSLANVLLLLKEMGRFDILLQIDWLKLCDNFDSFKETKKLECGDPLVLKLHSSLESLCLVQSENCGQTPNCPLTIANDTAGHGNITDISFGNDPSIGNCQKKGKIRSSAPCVLMTYASDAKSDALKIADQLRNSSIKRKKLNVVLLHNPSVRRKLLNDNANILQKWFNQVRYIVPVLSPQYVRQIQNLPNELEDHEEAVHNRFIYKLTLDQYVSFGARNLRCRPVCPEKFQEVKSNSVIRGNGLFSILWSSKEEKIEELGRALLDKPLLPPV